MKMTENPTDMPQQAGLTLQQRLHARIRAAVLSGALPPGARLPASRVFAKDQAVSRNSVLAVYDQLIAEGYLETRRGAGTFVASDLPDDFSKPAPNQSAHKRQPSSEAHDLKPNNSPEPPHTGLPAIDVFPKDIWGRMGSSAWRHADHSVLYHSDPKGYLPLRQAIAAYLSNTRSVIANPAQILIVSGLQQGMKLIADSLLGASSKIILEDPSYDGLLRTAKTCMPTMCFTPVDKSGACVPTNRHKQNLLVISPSHQYPLGITMPTARRLDLIKWAQQTDSLILEDDYDSEFRYEGRPLNSLQGIEGGCRVIYGGSFSKVTFPALRLGYLVLPKHLVTPVLKQREATDSFPSIMGQLALSRFISEGHFARHIRRMRKIHAARQQHYIRCFNSQLSRYFTVIASDAGLDLIARASNRLKQSAFSTDAQWAKAIQKAGLSALPISTTYRDNEPSQGLLLGFANFPEKTITTAINKLAHIMLVETGF